MYAVSYPYSGVIASCPNSLTSQQRCQHGLRREQMKYLSNLCESSFAADAGVNFLGKLVGVGYAVLSRGTPDWSDRCGRDPLGARRSRVCVRSAPGTGVGGSGTPGNPDWLESAVLCSLRAAADRDRSRSFLGFTPVYFSWCKHAAHSEVKASSEV